MPAGIQRTLEDTAWTRTEKGAATLVRASKTLRYCSLHHHSTFSYQDGFGLPSSHVDRAAELGITAIAHTEHGNVSSHVQLEQAAKRMGIKPIFGCELYTGRTDKKRSLRKNHLTVLAENQEGYRNLLRTVSQGWNDFYGEPTVNSSTLLKHRSGLIVLSGCTGSLFATSLVGGKNIAPEDASYGRAKAVARWFKERFGDNYYLEVQTFPELDKAKQINQAAEQIGRELGIPLVATGDVHYTRPNESEMQQILHSARGGMRQTVEELEQAWGYHVKLSPPTSDRLVLAKLRSTGLSKRASEEAWASTSEIAQRCTVELPRSEPIKFPLPPEFKSAKDLMLRQLEDGWHYRKIDYKKRAEEYRKRLDYEMSIILQKDFVDYFLLVGDVVRHAKDKGILVGPGRGSAAGSLVCYLLRITEVDPLIFSNLVFERFIDITRQDLPDIDLDFDDDRRDEIRDYLVDKYGFDRVANIGTFTRYKAKNSLDDVARVFRIPSWEVNKVKELLIERSSGDLRAGATIEDTLDQFEEAKDVVERYPDLMKASRLEGNYKGMGVHAAGMVVSNVPITDICAIYRRRVGDKKKNDVREVMSLDKYDAEYLGMLKMDLLGLSTKGLIRIAIELAGITLPELYGLPLDDPATLKAFHDNDTVGIFQFDGQAVRTVNAEVKASSFEEIADVTAIARPGPLHNNASVAYTDIKNGLTKADVMHPLFEAITGPTHGQILYQEQVLRIVTEIGKFDWTHAAYIRKIISRKIGDQEFNRQWGRFRDGALENGLSENLAKKIWGLCITSGSYAFNAAHSVSYALISYWCMWLKVHHPAAFYVGALEKYEGKMEAILRDAEEHGINILPPHPQKSEVSWKRVKTKRGKFYIRAGFTQIPGVGRVMAEAILEERERQPFTSWDDLIRVKRIGPKTVAKIRSWCEKEDPWGIYDLTNRIKEIKNAIVSGDLQCPMPTHECKDIPSFRISHDLKVVWAGKVTHRNLRDLFEVNFSRTGVALDPEKVKDPHLAEWVILTGMDDTDSMRMTIDRWKYPRFRKAVWGMNLDNDIVIVEGVRTKHISWRAIKVNRLWVIGA